MFSFKDWYIYVQVFHWEKPSKLIGGFKLLGDILSSLLSLYFLVKVVVLGLAMREDLNKFGMVKFKQGDLFFCHILCVCDFFQKLVGSGLVLEIPSAGSGLGYIMSSITNFLLMVRSGLVFIELLKTSLVVHIVSWSSLYHSLSECPDLSSCTIFQRKSSELYGG